MALPLPDWPAGALVYGAEVDQVIAAIEAYQEVTKTANQGLNTNTTLQDDQHLQLAIPPNTVHKIGGLILYTADAGRLKMKLTGPSGATGDWLGDGLVDTIAGTAAAGSVWRFVNTLADSRSFGSGGLSVRCGVLLTGRITTGASGGTLKVEWAQHASSGGNTSVLIGSYLSTTQMS